MSDAAWPRILGDPGLAAVYDALLVDIGRLGPFEVRHRRSAVQFVRPDGAGFAAVSPGGDVLVLTLVVDSLSTSPRILGWQAVSSDVWNQRIDLAAADQVDDELHGWLVAAYRRR